MQPIIAAQSPMYVVVTRREIVTNGPKV